MIEVESATATASTEELRKHVVMIHATISFLLPLSLFVFPNTFLALLIVDSSLVRIRKCLVGGCNLLELFLGCLSVILVLVWMIFD